MSALPRSFAIFALCIPLALLLGVMLATPLDNTTLLMVGACFLLLATPMLLKSHHLALIFSWGAYVNVFFLPGQPQLWMLMVMISLFFSVLTRTLNRQRMRFYWPASICIPLICFLVVTVITSELTGGVGLRIAGSEIFGGKRYIYLWMGCLLFFAMGAQRIPLEKRSAYALWFFLPGISAGFSNLAYALGPSFYWLYLFFPSDLALHQVAGTLAGGIMRISGLAWVSFAICCCLILRYGLRGILQARGGRLMVVFVLAAALGLFSGFRSHVVLTGSLLIFSFFAEGLWRTRYAVFAAVIGIVAVFVAYGFAESFPLSVQRSLTMFPGIKVDPAASLDSMVSAEWRLDMWRVVVNDIPQYFWVGKGYAINPTDVYLSQESFRRGFMRAFDPSLVSGDYHNGPLSVIITFGIFGALTFVWFLLACLRALWRNYRFGDPAIQLINTFLLAVFLTRVSYFLIVFGSLHNDFMLFTGIVGFSVALNGGIRGEKDLATAPETVSESPDEVPLVAVPKPLLA